MQTIHQLLNPKPLNRDPLRAAETARLLFLISSDRRELHFSKVYGKLVELEENYKIITDNTPITI